MCACVGPALGDGGSVVMGEPEGYHDRTPQASARDKFDAVDRWCPSQMHGPRGVLDGEMASVFKVCGKKKHM